MWEYINDSLMKFKNCFSRQAAFKWFVIIIVGLMVRTDHLGVASIIRALGIEPRHYETLIHFFRADSWELESLRRKWISIVARSGLIYRVCGKPLLIGDGVKQSKEGRKMPCVKKLVQESENSAKPHYIHGHHFGAIGLLIGTPAKWFCTLLSMRIHDGNEIIGKWAGDKLADESHVVRLVREACRVASFMEPCILALDRYFLTVPALTALAEIEEQFGQVLVSIVTKAKKNVVAYEKPAARIGKGRPAKKGASVKLQDLFISEAPLFRRATVNMYGRQENVEILAKDLLWGQSLYRELRFVLVKYAGTQTILVSTDLALSPISIIEIYSLRFKIENSFRELKQVIAGFSYHFWTSAMPKLKRFAKNDQMTEHLKSINDEIEKSAIVSTFNAIEGFATFAVIAFGLIQMGTLRFSKEINTCAFRWLRTKRNDIPSEATTVDFLRKTIFHGLHFSRDLDIAHFILAVQPLSYDKVDIYAS